MKIKAGLLIVMCACFSFSAHAQGLHFSQYYNAPMLLNPANTALMSENDYRVGVNYRDQWATIPVPYKTMSGFADFQLFRQEELANNWLGIGLAFFNDKAGDGQLALSSAQLSLAYHLQLGEVSMFSAGLYGGYVQRSIDYNKLTFDVQWDGFKFNTELANGEKNNIVKTTYIDAGAGINYAYFPNEAVYIKIGAGVVHVNAPNETFYDIDNKIGIRPIANADALLSMSESFTLNPSVYYSTQRGAYELIYGTQLLFYLGGKDEYTTQLILGGFHRWKEAAIGAFGMRWGGLKVMASYDYTMSKLSPDNNGNGALEISLIYLGNYGKMTRAYRSANCPRF
jgi:type IX secretion system PorP/SprF family membrane protein